MFGENQIWFSSRNGIGISQTQCSVEGRKLNQRGVSWQMALLASLVYTPALVIWIAAKYVIQNAPAVFSFPLQWWRNRLPNKWLVATWYLVCPSCSAQWTLSTQWYWLNPGGPQPLRCPTAYLFSALKLQLHIFCPSSNPPTFLGIELQQSSNVNGSFHISSPVPNG